MPSSVLNRIGAFETMSASAQKKKKEAAEANVPDGVPHLRMDFDEGAAVTHASYRSHPSANLNDMYDSLDFVNEHGVEAAHKRYQTDMLDTSVYCEDQHYTGDRSESEGPQIDGIYTPKKRGSARKVATAIVFIGIGTFFGMFLSRFGSSPSEPKLEIKPYISDKADRPQPMTPAKYSNETVLQNIAKMHGLPVQLAKNFATGDACWMEGYSKEECCAGLRNCWGKGFDGMIYTYAACCTGVEPSAADYQ